MCSAAAAVTGGTDSRGGKLVTVTGETLLARMCSRDDKMSRWSSDFAVRTGSALPTAQAASGHHDAQNRSLEEVALYCRRQM